MYPLLRMKQMHGMPLAEFIRAFKTFASSETMPSPANPLPDKSVDCCI